MKPVKCRANKHYNPCFFAGRV